MSIRHQTSALALAVLFLVTSCGGTEPAAMPPSPTPSPTPGVTNIAQSTLTPTPIPPTSTPSPTPVPTDTPAPSPSPVPPTSTPTDTPLPPADTPTPVPTEAGPFVEHLISKDTHFVTGIYIHDVDGDGDGDVLGAASTENQIAWWRNDGGTPIVWTKQTLDDDFGGGIFVYAADLDGDLDSDVLATAAGDNKLAWWRNDGGEPIVWTQKTIAHGLDEPQGIVTGDLDGDGDTDVVVADARHDRIVWWQNGVPSSDGSRWTEHTLADGFRNTQSVDAADFDGDGDIDIVATAGDGNKVAWWRNDGGSPLLWTRQSISPYFEWAHWVQACDLDGDGQIDVLSAAYRDGQIRWWRNAGGEPIVWQEQTIAKDFAGALAMHAADLDADGDLDVLGTADKVFELAWWRNDGGSPIKWTKQVLKDRYFGAWPVYASDIDLDGDVDVVAGASGGITWWENTIVGSAETP